MSDVTLNLRTVAQMSESYPAFTQASLRYWIFHAKENGLSESGALIRLGRKILLDEAAFIRWVRSHASSAEA